jgi:hypothetical protein
MVFKFPVIVSFIGAVSWFWLAAKLAASKSERNLRLRMPIYHGRRGSAKLSYGVG